VECTPVQGEGHKELNHEDSGEAKMGFGNRRRLGSKMTGRQPEETTKMEKDGRGEMQHASWLWAVQVGPAALISDNYEKFLKTDG